jgi:hypothetical protein
MPVRRLVTLTPYRLPTHYPLMLGDGATAAWLLADRALWHPAVLALAAGLPALADPADHAEPQPDTLYALPADPPPYLPDDWDDRVRRAGAGAFRTGDDWAGTLANLRSALASMNVDATILDRPDDAVRDGPALGFGLRVVEALAEAMDHPSLLDAEAFAEELRSARADAAARRLLAARDGLYPVTIHLIDIALLAEGWRPGPAGDGRPLTLVATTADLAALPEPQRDALRQRIAAGTLELAGGIARDRPDALLPVESQLWNLRQGCERTAGVVGVRPTVFARRTTAFYPDLPAQLGRVNLPKALFLAFDGAAVPHHAAASIRWSAPDGRSVDALTRAPQPAGDAQTFFHLAYHLHQSIMHDSAAVLLLRHGDRPAGPWYDDWLALSRLAPVLGTWTTAGRFLDETTVGEHPPATAADDFPPEELDAAIAAGIVDPVSRFARHARLRRRVDAAFVYLALAQSLGEPAEAGLQRKLAAAEDDVETRLGEPAETLSELEQQAAARLATRVVRSGGRATGWLVVNPSGFTRRVGLERDDLPTCPPTAGPVKAAQRDGELTRLVVEVPGFGFAWMPNQSQDPPPPRMTLAGIGFVRNEFFDAEIDAATGGLKSLREPRDRVNRLAQFVVASPGGTARCDDVGVTALGPALGEVTTRGAIVDAHGDALAGFTQRYRAWLGRPMLEIRITLEPTRPAVGGGWHSYLGCRFAWPDERAVLHRGVAGRSAVTTHHRPGAPEFLEWRTGRSRTLLVTGGLPFAQRHGTRMLDLILAPPGETATQFDVLLGLDRPHPAQAAQAAVSPVAVVPVDRGPPAVGPAGWLAHLDTSDLLVTSLRPAGETGVEARLLDVVGHGGSANWRWARPPRHATGDGVDFYVAANELADLRVEWD